MRHTNDVATLAIGLVTSGPEALAQGVEVLEGMDSVASRKIIGTGYGTLDREAAQTHQSVMADALALLRGMPLLALLFADTDPDPDADDDDAWRANAAEVLRDLDMVTLARVAVNAGALGQQAGRALSTRIAEDARPRRR